MVSWPAVSSGQAANGDGGMVQSCDDTNYSMGYVTVPYLPSAVKGSLGYAYLQNAAGNFVNISETTIESDFTGFSSQIPPSERISLVDGSGSLSYPLVNFEVRARIEKSDELQHGARSADIFGLGNRYQSGSLFLYHFLLNFIALPQNVFQLSMNQIEEISP